MPRKKELNKGIDNWASTIFYCPHCKHTFTHQTMWETLAKDYPNIWRIIELLRLHWTTVRKQIARYNLELNVEGTKDHDDWHTIALTTGYGSAEEMFYDLKIAKQWNYTKIAKMLDIIDVERVRDACKAFLNPNLKREVMEGRNIRKRRIPKLLKVGPFKPPRKRRTKKDGKETSTEEESESQSSEEEIFTV